MRHFKDILIILPYTVDNILKIEFISLGKQLSLATIGKYHEKN